MSTESNMAAEVRGNPRITLSTEDYERLSALAHAARSRMPDLASDLAEEIDRADVLANTRHLQHVVCMNCEVEFRDDTTGKVQKVTLVYPDEADILKRQVSVLTPVGTALIGLREGQSMIWQTPSGETRQLTVLAVRERHAT